MVATHVGAWAQTWGPGWGFGLGWAVLDDPAIAGAPQAKGTVQGLTVVILTNTAFEGMSGAFPIEVRDAIYDVF
jgi:hypothetical protein